MRAVRAAVLAVALVAGAWTPTAGAQSCGTLGQAQPFAIFSHSDYSAGNLQIKGRVAAGRDVTFTGSYGVGADQLPQDKTRLDVIAGRNLTATPNGSVQRGGASYGNSLGGTVY